MGECSLRASTDQRRTVIALIMLVLFASLEAAATGQREPQKGDPQKGSVRAEALYCGACHGNGGQSETPEWPSLAGQVAGYLEQQLKLFRSGERVNSEMGAIAASLTDEDIVDMSAYYATLSLRSTESATAEGTPIATLYRDGDPTRSIQACAACHGVTGGGDTAARVPALRAQQPTYTRSQLEAYALRSRYSSEGTPTGLDVAGLQGMYDVSKRLTSEEMQQLALYIRGLP